jgi:hypothetical protein
MDRLGKFILPAMRPRNAVPAQVSGVTDALFIQAHLTSR